MYPMCQYPEYSKYSLYLKSFKYQYLKYPNYIKSIVLSIHSAQVPKYKCLKYSSCPKRLTCSMCLHLYYLKYPKYQISSVTSISSTQYVPQLKGHKRNSLHQLFIPFIEVSKKKAVPKRNEHEDRDSSQYAVNSMSECLLLVMIL